jgi:hypothetical protein
MKLSQLRQIIKEEINELGFDYPGKTPSPSAYQNGIMDTLKAIQQLGVNVDVNAVMDILYPDDESPKDENPINENYVLDAMGTVLVGGVGLVLATAGVVGGTALALDNIQYGPIGDTIRKLKNKISDRKFNKYIRPILLRFKNDQVLQDMFEKYNSASSFEFDAIRKEIADYIESKLSSKELKYIKDVVDSLHMSDLSKSFKQEDDMI